MNIPLFQWITMAGYVTFIDPADLSRAWASLRRRLAGRLGGPLDVIYDGTCTRAVRLANVIRAIDIFGRLSIMDLHSSKVRTTWPELSDRQDQPGLLIGARGSWCEGSRGLLAISPLVPLLWPLAPLSLLFGQWKPSLRLARATK